MAIPKFHLWLGVPDRSTLRMTAEGRNEDGSANDNFDISVDLFSSGPDDREFLFEDLVPGPAEHTLRSPNLYIASVLLEFAGDPVPTVNFVASIIDDQGNPHQTNYTFSENDATTSHSARLFIGMQGGMP